jgi:NAD(P)-dependent dehydrogenase (short-subunit alcohol dehydrogenase family)
LVSSGLKNRSIVITGAFGSLGAVVTESARDTGAKIAAADLSDLRNAPTFGSGITLFGSVDLVSPVSAEAVYSLIADRNSGIDGLVNIACVDQEQRSPKEIETMFRGPMILGTSAIRLSRRTARPRSWR